MFGEAGRHARSAVGVAELPLDAPVEVEVDRRGGLSRGASRDEGTRRLTAAEMVVARQRRCTGSTSRVPDWATLVRAPNPGPMTLDGTNSWVLRAPAPASRPWWSTRGRSTTGHLAPLAACGPIAVVLVTHGHLDHVDGVGRLAS